MAENPPSNPSSPAGSLQARLEARRTQGAHTPGAVHTDGTPARPIHKLAGDYESRASPSPQSQYRSQVKWPTPAGQGSPAARRPSSGSTSPIPDPSTLGIREAKIRIDVLSNEKFGFQQKIVFLEERITKLQKTIDGRQREIDQLNKDMDNLHKELKRRPQMAQITDQQSRIQELEDANTQWLECQQETFEQYDQLFRSSSQDRRHLDEAITHILKLEDQIRDLGGVPLSLAPQLSSGEAQSAQESDEDLPTGDLSDVLQDESERNFDSESSSSDVGADFDDAIPRRSELDVRKNSKPRPEQRESDVHMIKWPKKAQRPVSHARSSQPDSDFSSPDVARHDTQTSRPLSSKLTKKRHDQIRRRPEHYQSLGGVLHGDIAGDSAHDIDSRFYIRASPSSDGDISQQSPPSPSFARLPPTPPETLRTKESTRPSTRSSSSFQQAPALNGSSLPSKDYGFLNLQPEKTAKQPGSSRFPSEHSRMSDSQSDWWGSGHPFHRPRSTRSRHGASSVLEDRYFARRDSIITTRTFDRYGRDITDYTRFRDPATHPELRPPGYGTPLLRPFSPPANVERAPLISLESPPTPPRHTSSAQQHGYTGYAHGGADQEHLDDVHNASDVLIRDEAPDTQPKSVYHTPASQSAKSPPSSHSRRGSFTRLARKISRRGSAGSAQKSPPSSPTQLRRRITCSNGEDDIAAGSRSATFMDAAKAVKHLTLTGHEKKTPTKGAISTAIPIPSPQQSQSDVEADTGGTKSHRGSSASRIPSVKKSIKTVVRASANGHGEDDADSTRGRPTAGKERRGSSARGFPRRGKDGMASYQRSE